MCSKINYYKMKYKVFRPVRLKEVNEEFEKGGRKERSELNLRLELNVLPFFLLRTSLLAVILDESKSTSARYEKLFSYEYPSDDYYHDCLDRQNIYLVT